MKSGLGWRHRLAQSSALSQLMMQVGRDGEKANSLLTYIIPHKSICPYPRATSSHSLLPGSWGHFCLSQEHKLMGFAGVGQGRNASTWSKLSSPWLLQQPLEFHMWKNACVMYFSLQPFVEAGVLGLLSATGKYKWRNASPRTAEHQDHLSCGLLKLVFEIYPLCRGMCSAFLSTCLCAWGRTSVLGGWLSTGTEMLWSLLPWRYQKPSGHNPV